MRILRRGVAVGLLLLGLGLLFPSAGAQDAHVVDLIELEGVIDPTSFEYLEKRLDQAQDDGVEAAIIRLDTPGGLDVAMRSMVQQILASEIPVVVWVAPQGARAASAGTFVTYAAHLAYMAAATEIGAASPVNLGGDSSDVLQEKAENDAAAFLREIALQRDRDPDFAEEAVREARSIGATEAVEIGAVENRAVGMAGDDDRLGDVVVAGQRRILAGSGDRRRDRARKIEHDLVDAAAGRALRVGGGVGVRVDDGFAQRAVIDGRRARQTVLQTFDLMDCRLRTAGNENEKQQGDREREPSLKTHQ